MLEQDAQEGIEVSYVSTRIGSIYISVYRRKNPVVRSEARDPLPATRCSDVVLASDNKGDWVASARGISSRGKGKGVRCRLRIKHPAARGSSLVADVFVADLAVALKRVLASRLMENQESCVMRGSHGACRNFDSTALVIWES